MNLTNPNQTLETAPLSNNNVQNLGNLNSPQMNQPNMAYPQMNPVNNMAFPVNAPQYNQNVSHQVNPNIGVNPTITNAPTITVNVGGNEKPKKTKTFAPLDLGRDPEVMTCPYCEEPITTLTKNNINTTALLVAIFTGYIGMVLVQMCKGKSIGCEDCEHSCPNCRRKIGKYNAW